MTRVRQYRSTLPKLLGLRFRDWVRLARAQVALLLAQMDVWVRPAGSLASGGTPATDRPADTGTPAASLRQEHAEQVGLAVRRVATHGVFRPTCLVRSLAICRLLRSEGITGGRIRVGVALRDGRFVAHAWVEYGGTVIGDDDALVRRYEAFDDLQVVAKR